jgi:hypothetical protein
LFADRSLVLPGLSPVPQAPFPLPPDSLRISINGQVQRGAPFSITILHLWCNSTRNGSDLFFSDRNPGADKRREKYILSYYCIYNAFSIRFPDSIGVQVAEVSSFSKVAPSLSPGAEGNTDLKIFNFVSLPEIEMSFMMETTHSLVRLNALKHHYSFLRSRMDAWTGMEWEIVKEEFWILSDS